jgi:hypothetical protein
MARPRMAVLTPTALGLLVSLLVGCSADSGSTDSSSSTETEGSAPTQAQEPSSEVFASDEPTLPGGVRVLSQAEPHDFVSVDPGRHAVRISDSLLYQVDVPDDSEVFGGTYLNPGRQAGHDSIVWVEPAGEGTALPENPCREHTLRAVGPTVEDLANALSDQPFLEVTNPVPVTLRGARGLLVTARVPLDADIPACENGRVGIIGEVGDDPDDDDGFTDPGTVFRMWVLDVGGERHVVHAVTFPPTPAQDTRIVTELVESMTFTSG